MVQKIIALIENNRPRKPIIIKKLTVHNTGNDGKGADAMANRNYFANHPEARASAHWVVDDKEAILCIPEDEQAWHTGTKAGNVCSIGVEICENRDADQKKLYENAIWLCADILHRHNLKITDMVTHKSWSGKYCPRKLLPVWYKFVNDVEYILNQMRKRDN